jgi:restriction endonuclease S subunit
VCYIDSIELIKSHSLSGIVPLNGGNFTYTNETTYRKIVPNLEISDTDYIDNITIISQKFDGKIIKIILDNCLNDGNIDLALQQKSEVVNSTTFTSHYVSGTTPPFRIREYV